MLVPGSRYDQVKLLWWRGSARNMSEGMQIATLCHTEFAEQHAGIRAAVSSVTQSILGRSPIEALRVDVVDKLVLEF
jgi:hypothetical protein